MTTITFIILGFFGLVLIWGIATFNTFISAKNHVNEAWSGIDVQLKRRYDLIPKIVDSVKGYMTHEKHVMQQITGLRSAAGSTTSIEERAKIESKMSITLGGLLAVAEQYPDLKAQPLFVDLQQNLATIESDLQKSRRFYNALVREFNTLAESFPSIIVAKLFNFTARAFFEIAEMQKEVPALDIR